MQAVTRNVSVNEQAHLLGEKDTGICTFSHSSMCQPYLKASAPFYSRASNTTSLTVCVILTVCVRPGPSCRVTFLVDYKYSIYKLIHEVFRGLFVCPIHYHVKETKMTRKYLYYFISQGPVVSLNMYLKDVWIRNSVFGKHKVRGGGAVIHLY